MDRRAWVVHCAEGAGKDGHEGLNLKDGRKQQKKEVNGQAVG